MPPRTLKVGDPVRFRTYPPDSIPTWGYGTIAQASDDNMVFTVQLSDGSSSTMDRNDLQVTTWPRDPDKTWPADQDCTHCPGQQGGQHKFGCAIGGARQTKISAVLVPKG